MNYTTNLNLKKPASSDFYDVSDFNGNMDTIDEKFGFIEGTLTAGSTSITLTSDKITTTGTYEYYTTVYGVSPKSVTVTTGSMTLTFKAQASNLGVKVRCL